MKAIVVAENGGPEVLQYRDADVPAVGPKQVLIRVAAASVNFADIKERIGFYGTRKPPFIPGLDATGTIEAVGSEVSGLKEGQRVIALTTATYAEYAVADEMLTFPISDNVDLETAAACPVVAFTSYHLLAKCARVQKGESVLIHAGAGGIGTTSIQLAKLLGAGKVIATVGSDEKAKVAFEAGADVVINYNQSKISGKVMEITNQQGVDVVLDSLAGDVFQESMKCLARYGRLVSFGNAKGTSGGQFGAGELSATCRSVIGFSLGSTIRFEPEKVRETAKDVLSFIENKKLKFMVGKSFSLKDASEAHRWIEDRKSIGKVLLYP
jgi:NADPH2:quinone reductase